MFSYGFRWSVPFGGVKSHRLLFGNDQFMSGHFTVFFLTQLLYIRWLSYRQRTYHVGFNLFARSLQFSLIRDKTASAFAWSMRDHMDFRNQRANETVCSRLPCTAPGWTRYEVEYLMNCVFVCIVWCSHSSRTSERGACDVCLVSVIGLWDD